MQQQLPDQYQQLQQNYPAGNNNLVWFDGRYSGAILVFDNNANYLGYFSMSATQQNPATLVKPAPKAASMAASGPTATAVSAPAASAPQ